MNTIRESATLLLTPYPVLIPNVLILVKQYTVRNANQKNSAYDNCCRFENQNFSDVRSHTLAAVNCVGGKTAEPYTHHQFQISFFSDTNVYFERTWHI